MFSVYEFFKQREGFFINEIFGALSLGFMFDGGMSSNAVPGVAVALVAGLEYGSFDI